MKGFATIHDTVLMCLEQHPNTRNSDALLYLKVCELNNPIACTLPFVQVMKKRKELGLPDYESVGRVRRKIQAEREDLRATDEVTDQRYENWKEAREYAFGE